MAFSSVTRALGRSPLTRELLTKLKQQQALTLNGISRIPKGLVASAIAQTQQQNLLVVTATLEEAGRWAAQLEAMGWATMHFYPTSEASPYDPFDPEAEMTWGQLQVLADLVKADNPAMAIVTTERALQPHLPPIETFQPFCVTLQQGMELDLEALSQQLAALGYDRVPLVETEGQWSRRGDIVDVFPVASELPVRLELFGDELDKIREFDPSTQRSLDSTAQVVLTATNFSPLILAGLAARSDLPEPIANRAAATLSPYLSAEELERLEAGQSPEGLRRFLGLAFEQPASLLDYLPANTIVAIDEPDQCQAHSDRWVEQAEEVWRETGERLPRTHRSFDDSMQAIAAFRAAVSVRASRRRQSIGD
jgi:transcription-repair coupling factor (superfamily II helicase)